MRRQRVSVFVHDLAANPIVRAAALARALAGDYDVEVLGFLHSGDAVYAPYRSQFTYKTMRVALDTTSVVRAIPRLAAMATGDIIYGCKPLLTSFGPALWASRVAAHRPLFLDAEDDEWAAPAGGAADFVWRHGIKGWRHATAWRYTRALHPFTRAADGVSVSTRVLQRRYGGTIARHGPDEAIFNPDLPALADIRACRDRWHLPASGPLALFAGVPQPHKGWSVLLDALARPECLDWHLVLAGPPDHGDFDEARRLLGDRCHLCGLIANADMPSLVAAVDAVPVPQLDVPFARAQLPAKVLEAMAMARPVVTTTIGDLPELLGDGSRGYLVRPGDAPALAAALQQIAARPDEAHRRSRAARAWFMSEASTAELARRLHTLFETARAPRIGEAA